MEAQAENNNEFRQLLNGLLDGQLTPEQWRQLEQDIQNRPEAMRLYIETVTLTVGLRKYSQTQRGAMKEAIQRQTPDESLLWKTLANEEKQAPTVTFPRKKWWGRTQRKTVEIRPLETNIHRVNRRISRYPIAFLLLATAALFLLLAYVQYFPSQPMAVLSDSIGAVWENHSNQFRQGKGFYPAAVSQTLARGFAQVRFESGAQVLFEAPCRFVVESNKQLFLQEGKIFVHVPKEALGFTVRTPSSRIIDLGTEFGAIVDSDGTSFFQMFSGKASLFAGLDGQEKVSELLLGGQARSVEPKTGKITIGEFALEQFARRINSDAKVVWRGQKSLNMVDFIVGGNGLQTEPKGCLCPVTGVVSPGIMNLTESQRRNPPRTYNEVSAAPFIDGVFVPDGRNGPVKVTSQDHVFAFPPTSGTIRQPLAAVAYYVNDKNEGSECPGPGAVPKPAFYLHSNLGVTFDLDAIRNAYSDMKITGFQTQYGIRWQGCSYGTKVDFWMLVDGHGRYVHMSKSADRKMEDVRIPLSDTDKFLTLATTESDCTLWHDWGVFVNPVIQLAIHTAP